MPKLMGTDETQVIKIAGAGNFQFSAIRIEDLGATEYSLVTIVCDVSGSVETFKDGLLKMIKTVVAACKKNPRAENLLLRLLVFNSQITEIHGFKELSSIDPDKYDPLNPDGFTALFDASYDGVGATLEFAKRLIEQDFNCNGVVYIITDGMDNRSRMTPSGIKKKILEALSNEQIESLSTILIALHDPNSGWAADVKDALDRFHKDAGLNAFVDIGAATPQKLAKLANWVSESVSSTSQALGTGAPSQVLKF
jgi:uncharacterized protein YegL